MNTLYNSKEECCGCGACSSVCPKSAITMQEDEYGFIYPMVDGKNCIECGLCIRSCHYKSTPDLHFFDGEISRDCCYQCPYAQRQRVGDITIGDYWGVQKYDPQLLVEQGGTINSKEGVSCLLINTERGQHLVEKYGAKIESYPVEFSNIAQVNTQLNRPTKHTRLRNSIRRAAMLVWKQFLSGISGTRSSYGECMTAFAECSAGKHGKAAAFGQNTHISVHQRQMFVKLLSILRPCNVHGFCL